MSAIRFGTDGIRGLAGRAPIDQVSAHRLGRVLGRASVKGSARVLVGRDTRLSGPDLAGALVAGVESVGGRARDLGILPTPALSQLLLRGWGAWGVMVTASHNPPSDNGLKILASHGGKLDDATQARIEADLDLEPLVPGPWPRSGVTVDTEARAAYIADLISLLPSGRWLEGRLVVADGAHGAGGSTLPAILACLGARVVELCTSPDGSAINVDCGALQPRRLARRVVEEGADAGIALDGDGDRGLLVTREGRPLDGDALLYLLATAPTVVGTVMTNAGLEAALGDRGIGLIRTPVGDRHVEAAVRRHGLAVGAEPSGHVCLADGLPTADGTLAMLRCLAGGLDLEARLRGFVPFPSRLVQISVACRPDLDRSDIAAIRDQGLEALGPGGRIVLRYSGTEPLLRLLVEGACPDLVEQVATGMAASLKLAMET